MIVNITSDDTELIFRGEAPRRLPSTIAATAKRRLDALNAAVLITTCAIRRGIAWNY